MHDRRHGRDHLQLRHQPHWAGCIAGALSEGEYFGKLRAAGFRDITLEVTRVYDAGDVRALLAGGRPVDDALARAAGGKLVAAFVRAVRPPPHRP